MVKKIEMNGWILFIILLACLIIVLCNNAWSDQNIVGSLYVQNNTVIKGQYCVGNSSVKTCYSSFGNSSWNQSLANTLYLLVSDQRYNDTDKINAVNTTQNIMGLSFYNSTYLDLFINNISGKLDITDQRYNDTAMIFSINNLSNVSVVNIANASGFIINQSGGFSSAGNSSWNESKADSKYYLLTNPNGYLNVSNSSYIIDTANTSGNIRAWATINGNTSWNESRANSLYPSKNDLSNNMSLKLNMSSDWVIDYTAKSWNWGYWDLLMINQIQAVTFNVTNKLINNGSVVVVDPAYGNRWVMNATQNLSGYNNVGAKTINFDAINGNVLVSGSICNSTVCMGDNSLLVPYTGATRKVYLNNQTFEIMNTKGANVTLNNFVEHTQEMMTNTLLDKSRSSLSTVNGELNYTLIAFYGCGQFNFNGTLYPLSGTGCVSNATITLLCGSNSTPKINYVYFYLVGNVPTLTTAESYPNSITHIDVGTFVVGNCSGNTSNVYSYSRNRYEVDTFVTKVIERFEDAGTLYSGGFNINASTNTLNISTGSFFNLLTEMTTKNNVNLSSGFYFINSTGNFVQSTSLADFIQYTDGTAFSGANERVNIVWGVVPVNTTAAGTLPTTARLVAVIPTYPGVGNTYQSVAAAVQDTYDTTNFFPSSDEVKKVFTPIARTILRPNTHLFEAVTTGKYYIDIRGRVINGGSTPSSGVTDHAQLSNLDYASSGHTGFASVNDNSTWNETRANSLYEGLNQEAWTNNSLNIWTTVPNAEVGIGTSDPVGILDVTGGLVNDTITGPVVEFAGSFDSPYFGFGQYENWLLNTESFATTWTVRNMTVPVSNTALSPIGTVIAEQLIGNVSNVNAGVVQSMTNNTQNNFTFSVWLRAYNSANLTPTININIETDNTTMPTSVKSINLTSSWKRYSVTQNLNFPHTTKTVTILIGGNNVSAWGAQFNTGRYALMYSGARVSSAVYGPISNVYSKIDLIGASSISATAGLSSTTFVSAGTTMSVGTNLSVVGNMSVNSIVANNITVGVIQFNDATHRIYDNSTCTIIKGSTSTLEIC